MKREPQLEGEIISVHFIDEDKKLVMPKKAHETDIGYDLVSTIDEVIAPGEVKLIPNGIVLIPPAGHHFKVYSRSGLALKHQVCVYNAPGVIDPDFSSSEDQICTILYNGGTKDFKIERGDRVSQLTIEKNIISTIVEYKPLPGIIEFFNPNNNRGGFGSTGRR